MILSGLKNLYLILKMTDNFPFRVGQGHDLHVLVKDRPLIIGGVHIPYEYGLLGHSDADVLLHAITDAILGAAGLGDIGSHFSDKDPRWAGCDSRVFLQHAVSLASDQGWRVVNIDSTIHAQAPKINPHVLAMKAVIAELLGLDTGAINIKAKTNEGLGYLGRSEGIAASTVVLLAKA